MGIVEISKNNIKNNILEVKKLQPNKSIMAVVKGNAYGHGVFEVVTGLIESGVNTFCVATLSEGIEIREKFKNITIVVLYGIFDQNISLFKKYDLEITISNKIDWENHKRYISENKIPTHFELDSGMNRMGFKDLEYFNNLKEEVIKLKIVVSGLCTHISQFEHSYDAAISQVNYFEKIVKNWSNVNVKNIHYMNSASIQMYKTTFDTAIRIGNFIYGYYDFNSQYEKNHLNKYNIYENKKIKPILRLKTKVFEIKRVKKGEFIGYGSYISDKDILLTNIDFGKLDGVINLVKYKIRIGNYVTNNILPPAMNHIFIEVNEQVLEGDNVYLYEDLNYEANQINKRPIDFIAYLDSSIKRELIGSFTGENNE